MEYKDLREVKTEGQFLKAICFKPKIAILICLIIGIALMFINNLYARLLAALCILMSFVVFKFVKDFKVIDIFDKGVLIYKGENNGAFINFDDIEMWAIRHEDGHDTIEFNLNNGDKIFVDSFEVSRAYNTLYSLIKEKEEKYIRAQKNKELNFSIPDALNNIKKKYKK